jgi:hypothetical protein
MLYNEGNNINFENLEREEKYKKTKKYIYSILLTLIYGYTFLAYSFSVNCVGWSSIRLQENSNVREEDFGFIYTIKAMGYFLGGFVKNKNKKRLEEYR